ncbi:MAG: hypothetical protein RIT40_238, partial [Planctomycetota bacterium]
MVPNLKKESGSNAVISGVKAQVVESFACFAHAYADKHAE